MAVIDVFWTFKNKEENFAMFCDRWPTTLFFPKQSFLKIATAFLSAMFEVSGLQDIDSRTKGDETSF